MQRLKRRDAEKIGKETNIREAFGFVKETLRLGIAPIVIDHQ